MAGCNNDIIVFSASIITGKVSAGKHPRPAKYQVGMVMWNKLYLLADRIYSKKPLFLHSVTNPCTEKESYFLVLQEERQKDMERAIGVF